MSKRPPKHRRRLTTREAKDIEACYFKPHYSGDASRKFWREVGSIVPDARVLYYASLLEDLEQRVLGELNWSVRTRVRQLVIARRRRKRR